MVIITILWSDNTDLGYVYTTTLLEKTVTYRFASLHFLSVFNAFTHTQSFAINGADWEYVHVRTYDYHMTKVHVADATIKSPKRAARKTSQKKEFVWSNDEAQLLLEVTHDYKVRHLAEGTCWDSVKCKYADIAELMKKELSANEARLLCKEYTYKPEEITKEAVGTI